MIDTVRYSQGREYSYICDLESVITGKGTFIPGFVVRCIGWDKYLIKHEQSGLCVVFCANRLEWVEVSLPRVVFGHNGKLIAWQRGIDVAVEAVDSILDRFSKITNARRVYTRVDLVWQFKGDPSLLYRAHRSCRHPMIRRTPIAYNNNGLEWRGSGLKILMYDKLLQQAGRNGNVIRVEVQFRGVRLRKLLGNSQTVTNLRFRRCYSTFRRIIKKFSPKLLPVISKPVDLIAFAAARHNVDLWPHWEKTYKNRQSLNRARNQFRASKLRYFRVRWSKLLPPSHPVWGAATNPTTHQSVKVFYKALKSGISHCLFGQR
jgi:hypothetical protein